jgi:hypothetical protein
MFTVLSNTRNSNLFLLGALAIVIIALFTLAIVPAISAPQPAFAPAPRLSEAGSDFYQRHPDWTWTVSTINAVGNSALSDYFQRHPELTVPSILGLGASDYFQRHPELTAPAEASVDMTDYYFRQAALQSSAQAVDLTDYFFRHP